MEIASANAMLQNQPHNCYVRAHMGKGAPGDGLWYETYMPPGTFVDAERLGKLRPMTRKVTDEMTGQTVHMKLAPPPDDELLSVFLERQASAKIDAAEVPVPAPLDVEGQKQRLIDLANKHHIKAHKGWKIPTIMAALDEAGVEVE